MYIKVWHCQTMYCMYVCILLQYYVWANGGALVMFFWPHGKATAGGPQDKHCLCECVYVCMFAKTAFVKSSPTSVHVCCRWLFNASYFHKQTILRQGTTICVSNKLFFNTETQNNKSTRIMTQREIMQWIGLWNPNFFLTSALKERQEHICESLKYLTFLAV